MISFSFPMVRSASFPGPVTVAEVAASIGTGLAKAALGGRVGSGDAARWSISHYGSRPTPSSRSSPTRTPTAST